MLPIRGGVILGEEPVGSARRLASRRAGPWAPLAGSLRAGQARGLRSQARFAQGRPVGSARRLASRRAGPGAPLAGSLRAGQATEDPLIVATVGVGEASRGSAV